MNWFRNMRIEVKFVGAFILVASIALIVGFIGIRNMGTINDMADRMYEKELLGLSHVKQANVDLLYLIRAEKNMILASSEADRQKYADESNQYDGLVLKSIEQAKPLFYTEKGKELFRKVEKEWEEYKPVRKQVIDLAMKENMSEKRASVELSTGLARQKVKAVDETISELAQLKADNAKKVSIEGSQIYTSSRTLMIVLAITGFIAGIGLGIISTLSITRPMKRIIDGLSEGAAQVAAASGQVSGASQELADGASEQAASIEETSSSLEEMSSMTKQNAASANQANSLMSKTREVVATANDSMGRLTISMEEISKASEETSKIIKTIDEIAFQTNLLALNAAVEAARAGEAGAGFAVVADEVRNLAMRAAEAAKNTSNLIEGTVKKIKEGSEIVGKTNEEFSEVEAGAAKMAELVGEISAASGEQAQGIEQVNKAVTEMDKVVQRNAANAEESAAASEEMNAQAAQLKEFVGDLVRLIGGANGHGGVKNSEPARGRRTSMKTAKHSVKALTVKEKRANGKDLAGFGKREFGPEQVIPFDDSEISQF